MNTRMYTLCGCLLISAGMSLMAQETVLPEGMIALTGDNVKVTSVDSDNRTHCEKPVVKTANGKLFFTASTTDAGEEIWISELTAETTKMIKDINTGTESSNPKWLTAVGNNVYFAATTATGGEELWVTDGTEEGTKQIKDIYEGTGSASPFGLTAFQGKLLFFAMDEESEFSPVIDAETAEKWLWVTDGTEEGTTRIGDTPTKETNFDGDAGYIVPVGNKAFFVGYDAVNNESLWITDGTKAGTQMLKNINPATATGTFATESGAIDWLTNVNDQWLVFRAETVEEATGKPDVGNEIWISDGTAAGTKWIGFDFATGETNGVPTQTQFACTRAYNDTLYFRANDGVHGVEPCVFFLNEPITEGINPRIIYDVNHWNNNPSLHSWPSQFVQYQGDVYIQANGGYFMPNDETEYGSGYSLWRMPIAMLDTAIYQKQIWGTEIFAGNSRDDCDWFTEVNGKLFFAAKDAANNQELWVIADKNTAPAKVVDLPDNGLPCQLTNVGNNLYFVSNGTQKLYKYDIGGTSAIQEATKPLLSIYPNPATDIVHLNSEKEATVISIRDLTGKTITEYTHATSFSVGNLPYGIYIVTANFVDGSQAKAKLIVR